MRGFPTVEVMTPKARPCREVVDRISEFRRVREVEELGAKIENVALGERERALNSQIEIELAGAAQNSDAAIAEARPVANRRCRGERSQIEVAVQTRSHRTGRSGIRARALGARVADEISVDGSRRTVDWCDRQPRLQDRHAGNLPTRQKLLGDSWSRSQIWSLVDGAEDGSMRPIKVRRSVRLIAVVLVAAHEVELERVDPAGSAREVEGLGKRVAAEQC